jgi:3',5'-cyclic AMP phosphodiesterase CpdA
VVLPCLGLFPAVLAAQEEVSPSATEKPMLDDGSQFQFAVVSDRAANPRLGVFENALKKVALLRPDFVLSVGDFIHGYAAAGGPLTEEAKLLEKRDHVDAMFEKLPMRFFFVPGNHDINNDMSERIWKQRYGNDYYAFEHQGVLFLCLNSQDGDHYGAGIGKEQIAYVRSVLEKHPQPRWTFVFLHQPLWLIDDQQRDEARKKDEKPSLTGFDAIEALLTDHPYTVIAGHHHHYKHAQRKGRKYIKLATTGGQSSLDGPETGRFDHVLWVTMTERGPVMCNLLVEGVLDERGKVID